jgi:hypothetical protein
MAKRVGEEQIKLHFSHMMMCSLDNYLKFFEQAFANLAPGGLLEIADPAWPIKSNMASLFLLV